MRRINTYDVTCCSTRLCVILPLKLPLQGSHLLTQPGVAAIHDLHIWGMSTTETALTCHLVIPGGHPGDAVLSQAARELEARFGIHHTTIQVELADTDNSHGSPAFVRM